MERKSLSAIKPNLKNQINITTGLKLRRYRKEFLWLVPER